VLHPDSVGAPVPVVDVRICDDAGHVPVGRSARSGSAANVVKGYWRARATAGAPGGWLRSGDVGRVDDEASSTSSTAPRTC
jgi:long-subunit acyl-CoA synthetase (AMP-forming)